MKRCGYTQRQTPTLVNIRKKRKHEKRSIQSGIGIVARSHFRKTNRNYKVRIIGCRRGERKEEKGAQAALPALGVLVQLHKLHRLFHGVPDKHRAREHHLRGRGCTAVALLGQRRCGRCCSCCCG